MTDAMKRLYKFLVKMNRITKEQYEQIVGEPYNENLEKENMVNELLQQEKYLY